MKREELWLIYIKKNPKFVQEGAQVTFTAKGIRQFFERTFDHAFDEGVRDGIKTRTPDFNMNDFFGDMFKTVDKTTKKF